MIVSKKDGYYDSYNRVISYLNRIDSDSAIIDSQYEFKADLNNMKAIYEQSIDEYTGNMRTAELDNLRHKKLFSLVQENESKLYTTIRRLKYLACSMFGAIIVLIFRNNALLK